MKIMNEIATAVPSLCSGRLAMTKKDVIASEAKQSSEEYFR